MSNWLIVLDKDKHKPVIWDKVVLSPEIECSDILFRVEQRATVKDSVTWGPVVTGSESLRSRFPGEDAHSLSFLQEAWDRRPLKIPDWPGPTCLSFSPPPPRLSLSLSLSLSLWTFLKENTALILKGIRDNLFWVQHGWTWTGTLIILRGMFHSRNGHIAKDSHSQCFYGKKLWGYQVDKLTKLCDKMFMRELGSGGVRL